MDRRTRPASTAASRRSESTASAAKPASLRDLMELRDRHQTATRREAEARARRERAQENITALTRDLAALGYNEKVNGDFDAWYQSEVDTLDETMSEMENLLSEALG